MAQLKLWDLSLRPNRVDVLRAFVLSSIARYSKVKPNEKWSGADPMAKGEKWSGSPHSVRCSDVNVTRTGLCPETKIFYLTALLIFQDGENPKFAFVFVLYSASSCLQLCIPSRFYPGNGVRKPRSHPYRWLSSHQLLPLIYWTFVNFRERFSILPNLKELLSRLFGDSLGTFASTLTNLRQLLFIIYLKLNNY